MSAPEIKKLAEFLNIGRTIEEIAKQLGVSPEEAKKLIVKKYDGWNMFPSRNRRGETIYALAPEIARKIVAPKVWTFDIARDSARDIQPFMRIRLPDDLPGNRVKIYPIGDVHYGAKGHNHRAFVAHLKLVAEKEHAFFVGLGDMIENALVNSPGGAMFDQVISPHDQITDMRELLRPIAHKCFVAVNGNHEGRTDKVAGVSPLEFGICDPLEIPYFGEPVYLDILWRGQVFTFFIQHGSSGAQTKGGKLNSASRPLSWNEHTMFTLSGHVHDLTSGKNIKRCLEFIRDANSEIIDMRVVKREEYVIICGSTYGYLGTYAARAGYSPGAQGIVPACVLEDSGKFYLEKKPLILEE